MCVFLVTAETTPKSAPKSGNNFSIVSLDIVKFDQLEFSYVRKTLFVRTRKKKLILRDGRDRDHDNEGYHACIQTLHYLCIVVLLYCLLLLWSIVIYSNNGLYYKCLLNICVIFNIINVIYELQMA